MNLPQELIKIWKLKYGEIKLITVKDIHFIYRRLRKFEIEQVKDQSMSMDQDMQLMKLSILWCSKFPRNGDKIPYIKEDFNKIPSMIPVTLKLQILEYSGFAEKMESFNNTIVARRGKLANLFTQMEVYILRAFPTISPNAVGKMYYNDFLDYYCLAEKVLGSELEFDPNKVNEKVITNPHTGHKTVIKDLKAEVLKQKKKLGMV